MKLVLPLLAAASLAAQPTFAADSIRVGLIGPYSGGSSPMGLCMRNGVRLAAAEINAAGGVLGRRFELLERDDEANNEKGAQLTQDLVAVQKVHAVLGYINTGVAKASVKIPLQARVPTIVNVSTGIAVNEYFKDETGRPVDNYIFQTSASDLLQSDLIVTELVDRFGFQRIAVLNDDTGYGMSGRALVQAELKKRGLEPAYLGTFKIKDTEMQPMLQEAKSAESQAIVVYGIGPENAAIARARGAMQWRVLIVGSWTMSMSNFIDNAGLSGEGVMMPQTFIQDAAGTSRQKKFVADYLREFKPENDRIPSAVSAAQGYDSAYLLAEAIKQAGSTDGPQVRAALENLASPVRGVVATYARPFSMTAHSAIRKEQVGLGGIKGGRVALVTAPLEPLKE